MEYAIAQSQCWLFGIDRLVSEVASKCGLHKKPVAKLALLEECPPYRLREHWWDNVVTLILFNNIYFSFCTHYVSGIVVT